MSGFSRFSGFSGFSGFSRFVRFGFLGLLVSLAACSNSPEPTPPPVSVAKPADSQHAGITTPHGDHTPHHGGMVLMNGELHYEVVFDPGGKHQIWFSNAVRDDLPASFASDVVIVINRKNAPPERLVLSIDENGESWIAKGEPVVGDDVMVKVTYAVKGDPFEVEIPFVIPVK
jgi:hypothetical protein